MAYNPETKTITGSVSVADIQQALGKNIKDVKTLCLQNNVNMLSKFKPTSARGIFVHEDEDKWWQGMSVGTDTYDTPQHYLFYTGVDYAGIYKPYMVVTDSNLKPGGYILNSMAISDDFLNKQWKHSIINRQSFLPTDTAGRELDFKNYIHTDKKRNDVPWTYQTGDTGNILRVTNNFYYSSGDTFDISCQFNFALSTQIEGSAALLGMCDIFGRNNLSGKPYYGIIVTGEQLSKRGRLTLIYISGKGIGDSNDDTSGGTGLSYCTNINLPTGDFLDQHDKSTNVAGSKKFYRKEQITIIPFIARQGGQKWYISNLNLYCNRSNPIYSTVTIPDYQAADISMFYFSNMKIDIAYYKDADNNSVFEVNGGNALRFVVKNLNPNASSSTPGYITFAAPWELMIGPADGNTASLNVKRGTVGDGSSHKLKNVTDGQTITQTSAIISDYSSTNCPYLKLKPLDGVTEFKVSITFSYYRPVKGANDTYSMHKFMATATQSFNPSSINTTRQTREFIFFQKDLETQSDTSEYVYCLGFAPGQQGGGTSSIPNKTLTWKGPRHQVYTEDFYSYKIKKDGTTPIPVPFNFNITGFQSICTLRGNEVQVVDNVIRPNASIGAEATLNDNVQVDQTYRATAAVTQSEAGSNLTLFVGLEFTRTS